MDKIFWILAAENVCFHSLSTGSDSFEGVGCDWQLFQISKAKGTEKGKLYEVWFEICGLRKIDTNQIDSVVSYDSMFIPGASFSCTHEYCRRMCTTWLQLPANDYSMLWAWSWKRFQLNVGALMPLKKGWQNVYLAHVYQMSNGNFFFLWHQESIGLDGTWGIIYGSLLTEGEIVYREILI